MLTETKPTLDSVQFTKLILIEEKYLRSYIARKVYNRNDIDDAYQTTLMEAYRSKSNYRGDATPRVWICGIANNIAIRFNKDHISSRSNVSVTNSRDLIKVLEDNFADIAEISSIDDMFEMEQLCKNIGAAIDSLDDDLRNVFTDVVINGERYQEVASRYSIPIGTVKSRIAKVRDQLRTTILSDLTS